MEYAVSIKNLHFKYTDGTTALDDINIDIRQGSKTAILGPNGAGKSTLLLHLNGINTPTKGDIYIMGEKISSNNVKSIRKKVGLVFQDPDDQVFSGTVYEDVAFGPSNLGLSEEEVGRKVKEALEIVSMTECSNKSPLHLSYGQKKRVAIAGVLAMESDIIVLDEPVAYLDPAGSDSLFQVLDILNSKGKTIIAATHDVNLAAEWADNIIVISEGKVIANGGKEVLIDEKIIYKASLKLPVVSTIFKKLNLGDEIPVTIDDAVKKIRNMCRIDKGR